MEDLIDDVAGLQEVLEVREIGRLGVLEVHQGAVFVVLLEGAVEGSLSIGTRSVTLGCFSVGMLLRLVFQSLVLELHQGEIILFITCLRRLIIINRPIMPLSFLFQLNRLILVL